MRAVQRGQHGVACLIAVACTAFAATGAVVSSETEIVVSADAPPLVKFAAEEMKDILFCVFGCAPHTVNSPTRGKTHIFLGSNVWATAAGVRTEGLPRDAFRLKCDGGDIYIAGRDDPKVDQFAKKTDWERATVFGVYEFLERYAGVRFYFPGELGTITPRARYISVPPALDETVKPVFSVRRYSDSSDGEYFEGPQHLFYNKEKSINNLRLRMQSEMLPCCHGQNDLKLLDRFGKSNPEYFVMTKDGSRRTDPLVPYPGMICLTSCVWDEIYKDCEAYLLGGNRGFRWGVGFRQGKYCDIMCQDGLIKCNCETCRERLGPGRYWASEIVWSNTCAIANRLAAKGIPGYITQMAYGSYRGIPQKTEIPDNVLVMLALRGPWSMHEPKVRDRDLAEIKGWVEKMHGRKVWLWNYINKYRFQNLPDIPTMTPRMVGEYYKMVSPYIFGAFMQSDCDRFMYNHLNYAVFSRFCWHEDVDVDAFLSEYHALMFGPAAKEMQEAFDIFERKWGREIANSTIEMADGPMANPPCEYAIWHYVYSPKTIDGIEKLFDAAAAKVAADSLEGRRVALMRRELFDPLARRARAYIAASKPSTPTAGGDAMVLESADGTTVKKSIPLDGSRPKLARLEAFKRYRLSFNVEAQEIEPTGRGGGTAAWVGGGVNQMFPMYTGNNGTFPRTRIEYTFFTGPDANSRGKRAFLDLVLHNARGRAIYDDLKVEEIPLHPSDVRPVVSARAVPADGGLRCEVQIHTATMKRICATRGMPKGVFSIEGKDGKKRKFLADKYDKTKHDGLLKRVFTAAELGPGATKVEFELLEAQSRRVLDRAEIDIPQEAR